MLRVLRHDAGMMVLAALGVQLVLLLVCVRVLCEWGSRTVLLPLECA